MTLDEDSVVATFSPELLSTSSYDSCLAAAKDQFLPFPVQNEPTASLRTSPQWLQSREPCDMKGDAMKKTTIWKGFWETGAGHGGTQSGATTPPPPMLLSWLSAGCVDGWLCGSCPKALA